MEILPIKSIHGWKRSLSSPRRYLEITFISDFFTPGRPGHGARRVRPRKDGFCKVGLKCREKRRVRGEPAAVAPPPSRQLGSRLHFSTGGRARSHVLAAARSRRLAPVAKAPPPHGQEGVYSVHTCCQEAKDLRNGKCIDSL